MDQNDMERILGNAQPRDDGGSVLRRFHAAQAAPAHAAQTTARPARYPALFLFAIAAAACALVLLPMYFFNDDSARRYTSQDEPQPHGPSEALTYLGNPQRTGYFGYAQHRDGREQRPALFALHTGDEKHALRKFDLASGRLLWEAPLPALYESALTVAAGRVFAGGTDGFLRAFDAMTGAQLWAFNAGGTVHGAPCATQSAVYFGALNGNVYCLDAASGLERWRAACEDAVWNTPAFDRGKLYFCSHNGIFHCVDAVHGTVLWNSSIESGHYGSCLVAQGRVYTGTDTGKVICLDAASGNPLWQQQVATLPAQLVWWSSLTFDGARILAGGFDGTLYAFDPATGEEAWHVGSDSLLRCTAATADGLIVQNIDGVLRAVTRDGELQWTLSDPAARANASCSPVLFEHKIYINSDGGELLVFDLRTGKLAGSKPLSSVGRSALAIAR